MNSRFLGSSCRNFQILGIEKLTDPRDGREKVVLSNFAAGTAGNLILVDPETGEGESLPLPGDSGAWAVHNWHDQKLLVGTCGHFGYLHCLDLVTREWAEPLRDANESYIWNFCVGSDGLVYGGTYPGCVLLQYDPNSHRLAIAICSGLQSTSRVAALYRTAQRHPEPAGPIRRSFPPGTGRRQLPH